MLKISLDAFYFRYHASVVKRTIINPCTCTGISSNVMVPEPPQLTQTKSNDADCLAADGDDRNLVELDPMKQHLDILGPSLSELQDIDPFLIFLCYRGFNHISGKVQNGK